MGISWTAEMDEQAGSLWKAGSSAAQVATIMKLTRGAVIGRIYRLGLSRKRMDGRPVRSGAIRPPVKRPPRPRAQRWANPSDPAPLLSVNPLPPEPPVLATALRLTLMQLTDATCKCGLGDPKHSDFAFCGLPVKVGSPYCSAHHPLMYSDVRTRNARSVAHASITKRESERSAFDRWAA